MLNFRDQFSIFHMPTFEQIASKMDIALNKDRFTLKPMRFRNEGKFVVYCQVHQEDPPPLKFEVNGRFNEGKQEITVTILDCFDTPADRTIVNKLFDDQFEKISFTLEKATVMQVHQNRTTLNGNHFCVLDTQIVNKIPNSISFFDTNMGRQVKFQCRFRGQTWFCHRCNADHTSQCKQLKNFYERRDERTKQKKH